MKNNYNIDIIFPMISTIISINAFLHGLTQLMTLVTSFVVDVFAGEERYLNSFEDLVISSN